LAPFFVDLVAFVTGAACVNAGVGITGFIGMVVWVCGMYIPVCPGIPNPYGGNAL